MGKKKREDKRKKCVFTSKARKTNLCNASSEEAIEVKEFAILSLALSWIH